MSAGWSMKRFWRAADVARAEGGWGVRLDGRPVRTPGKLPLVLPSARLAEAIAAEWEAQEDEVRPATMPLTRTANSAVERVAPRQAEVADLLAEYGATDLLCYRAAAPAELVARQEAAWQPWLDWAERRYGARLVVATGLMPVPQDPASLAHLAAEVQRLDPFELAAVHDLVTLPGSLVLGLAVLDGALAPPDGWPLGRIDEDWQAELWGEDAEAAEVAARKKAAYLDAARFLALARGDG